MRIGSKSAALGLLTVATLMDAMSEGVNAYMPSKPAKPVWKGCTDEAPSP